MIDSLVWEFTSVGGGVLNDWHFINPAKSFSFFIANQQKEEKGGGREYFLVWVLEKATPSLSFMGEGGGAWESMNPRNGFYKDGKTWGKKEITESTNCNNNNKSHNNQNCNIRSRKVEKITGQRTANINELL